MDNKITHAIQYSPSAKNMATIIHKCWHMVASNFLLLRDQSVIVFRRPPNLRNMLVTADVFFYVAECWELQL